MADKRSLLSASWTAMHNRLQAFKLLGRPWRTSQAMIRVSKVINLGSFLRNFALSSDLLELPLAVAVRELQRYIGRDGDISSLISFDRLTGGGVPQWVTLHEEIEGRDIAEILQELGTPRDWVSSYSCLFEYTIDSSDLRTPTVIDASLAPWFVSKTSHPSEIPRAWNWKENRWGLPEFVHAPTNNITNPTLRLFAFDRYELRNELRAQLLLEKDLFAGYSQFETSAIEQIVQQILMQVSAHDSLQSFISGSSDILSLTPLEFERFIETLYRRRGFKTTLTKASRDGGFDVIAFSDSLSKRGVLIQAKKVHGTVGIGVIRELIGARFLAPGYGNYMLVVAASGRFSSVARRAAMEYPTHLELQDYRALEKELRMYAQFGVRDIAREARRVRNNGLSDDDYERGT